MANRKDVVDQVGARGVEEDEIRLDHVGWREDEWHRVTQDLTAVTGDVSPEAGLEASHDRVVLG